MKRLVISGLLSLAAVSCGSSKTTADDVVKHFCGGAAAADLKTAKSCYGAAWTTVTAPARTATGVVEGTTPLVVADCNAAATAKAKTITDSADNDTDAKKSEALKKLIDESKFGTTEDTNKEVCAKITIS